MRSPVTGIAVLILILHLIPDPRNHPAPSKKSYAASKRPDWFLIRIAQIALCLTTNDTLRFYLGRCDVAKENYGNGIGRQSWPGDWRNVGHWPCYRHTVREGGGQSSGCGPARTGRRGDGRTGPCRRRRWPVCENRRVESHPGGNAHPEGGGEVRPPRCRLQ